MPSSLARRRVVNAMKAVVVKARGWKSHEHGSCLVRNGTISGAGGPTRPFRGAARGCVGGERL
jgi:hypothetical protein